MDNNNTEKKENNQNIVSTLPEDKTKDSMKSQDESTPLAKSEEHIYSYSNEKKKTTPNTPLKKPFKIISLITGAIGIYLLCFSLFLIIRGGYVASMMNDINSNCRNAMVILSVFVIFTSATGYAGAYTNWKPLVLTFTVFSTMCLVGHFYVAKKELDAVRFARRDMALSWWDVYTDETRKAIEEKYTCCGYRYYNDLPVASANCLESDVATVRAYDVSLKTDIANTEKFDSYQKHFGDPDTNTSNQSTVPVNNTPVNPPVNPPVDNTPVVNPPVDNTPVVNPPVDNTPVVNPPVDNTPVVNPPVDNTPVVNPPVDNTPVVNPPVDNTPVVNPPVDNTPAVPINNTPTNSFIKKRQATETVSQELAIMSATPCEGFIVNEITSKLKIVYIINFSLCAVYVIAIALSLKYWMNMRKEKEFDEFA